MPAYDEAVSVQSMSDEYAYVCANPCPTCGGEWKVRMQALIRDDEGRHYDRIDVICKGCRSCSAFLFDISSFFPKRLG